jgi:hypothetical protein
LRYALERCACHQPLDAFVDITEPLFETHHGLPAGGEAEMPRLDDAGMHRPDRDLMQMFALDGQKFVGLAVVEPGAPASP